MKFLCLEGWASQNTDIRKRETEGDIKGNWIMGKLILAE